jgi:regulator of sigma D
LRQLFSIEVDGDVTLQDDTFVLIPELKQVHEKLGDDYIRYIVFFCDYYSPYRQLIKSKRKEEICSDIWDLPSKKVKDIESEIVKSAVEKYKRLQYDPIMEQYIVYTEKIAEYNNFISEMPIQKDNMEALARVMKSVRDITEAREELKELILKKEEESKMMGGGEASLLEEMMG